jgi:hypothetical protein
LSCSVPFVLISCSPWRVLRPAAQLVLACQGFGERSETLAPERLAQTI